MEFKDFIENKNVFSDREESELVKAKKKVKNILMDYLFKGRGILSSREIQVYKLVHEKNLTHSEISEKLRISRQSSRNYLFRANRKIKNVTQLFEENKNIDKKKLTDEEKISIIYDSLDEIEEVSFINYRERIEFNHYIKYLNFLESIGKIQLIILKNSIKVIKK